MTSPEHRILLSLPPAMAGAFQAGAVREKRDNWFATCDPAGSKLGSGGGIVRSLHEAWKEEGCPGRLEDWICKAPSLVMLAGGQSRRLPAYAATGKVFMPMPALRWALGQSIDGTLLDFMLPEFQRVLKAAGREYPLMICSGDVVLKFPEDLPDFPVADVLGLGMWVAPETASHFGVFFSKRESPQSLAFFKQKPAPEIIREHSSGHLAMVDTGIWLLNPKAIAVLLAQCGWDSQAQCFGAGLPSGFELYAGFGPALGETPVNPQPEISSLHACVSPWNGAEFFHLGTSRQIIESLSALQNCQLNQLRTGPLDLKPHPDIYILNADFAFRSRTSANHHVWIENSTLPADMHLESHHVITGVPPLELDFHLDAGVCLDIAPIGASDYCVRVYGFDDLFSGQLGQDSTRWIGEPAALWFERRGLSCEQWKTTDIQLAPIFPVVSAKELTSDFLHWLHGKTPDDRPDFRKIFMRERLSAMEICEQCDIGRLESQRRDHIARTLPRMRSNSRSNPFYRLDLSSAAPYLKPEDLSEVPNPDPMNAVHDAMLRAEVLGRSDEAGSHKAEAEAFGMLAGAILQSARPLLKRPQRKTLEDQIVWGRSPVRLDLAGGWTDTPPYCFKLGGGVVNLAVDVNGQPPVQVFLKSAPEPVIVLRSIDLGVETRISTYEDLGRYAEPGSGFALARAALCLAGFHPDFQAGFSFPDLRTQLEDFGGGLEISLLAAAPKGSGLGTSSILGATLLGALSDACGLGWDHAALINLTLAIEQMLTTCGGWQDQAGAIYRGVKFIGTEPGLNQQVSLRWVPDHLFTQQECLPSARLYYTGITRMASGILRSIVRGMFLNSRTHLARLADIRRNADYAFEALQHDRWEDVGRAVSTSWELNCALDPGTDPPAVRDIFRRVEDWTAGAKLLGAGGGGYALFLAKDEEAARRIQRELEASPPSPSARFVDFSISHLGLKITRS